MPLLAHTDHRGLICQLVDGHPDVSSPVVSLVQRQDPATSSLSSSVFLMVKYSPADRQETGDRHTGQPQPVGVLEVVADLLLHQQVVGDLLEGVHHPGGGQADERVDGEEESFLLVRPSPEDQQPQTERGLGEEGGLRAVVSGHFSPEEEPAGQQDRDGCQRQEEDQVEVEDSVHQVELGRLSPVQVGAVGGEDVVEEDVEAGHHRLAVVVTVAEDLRQEDYQGGGH